MSFADNTGTAIFPVEFIRKCVETYTKVHGKAPLVLVVSESDYADYLINCTMACARQFGLQVTYGTYLNPGEIDLCMGIKE